MGYQTSPQNPLERGKIVDEPVSTLDLSPTFCDYANASPLLTQHGQSLRPLIETDHTSRDFAYAEWELHPNRVGVGLSLRTVHTKTHKLTLDLGSSAGELYALVDDPDEMKNRFDELALSAIQQELIDMIHEPPNDAGPVREPVGAA